FSILAFYQGAIFLVVLVSSHRFSLSETLHCAPFCSTTTTWHHHARMLTSSWLLLLSAGSWLTVQLPNRLPSRAAAQTNNVRFPPVAFAVPASPPLHPLPCLPLCAQRGSDASNFASLHLL
ncbi:MAG: hypothetical protein ACPIOQ_43130, partial [Promethearchaeia archaeon]